jgi:PDZ domain-containing protein
VILMFALIACHEERPAYVVDVVLPGFDATTKLQPGDRILEIDGEPLRAPVVAALVSAVNARDGAPVTLSVERDGRDQTIVVRPQQDRTNDGRASWVLGIRPRVAP